jgi:hypothetical protein
MKFESGARLRLFSDTGPHEWGRIRHDRGRLIVF